MIVYMGNQVTIISWPDSEYNTELVRIFSDIRQSLGIDICSVNYSDPKGYCSVRGNTAPGIEALFSDTYHARLWLKRCRKIISGLPHYGLKPEDINSRVVDIKYF